MAKHALHDHLSALAAMGVSDAALKVLEAPIAAAVNGATKFHAIPEIAAMANSTLAVKAVSGAAEGIAHGGSINKSGGGISV